MRIAIDTYPALFTSGGIARYARALISAAAEIDTTTEFVLFYNRFRERGVAWKPDSGRCTVRQAFFPRRALQTMWDFAGWPPIEMFCGSIDLFHGLHFILPPVRSAHRILTIHDLTYLKYPAYFAERSLNERGYRRELPRGLTRADMVIAVSQKTREDLIELLKFPEERVRVVHLGVDHRLFSQPDDEKAETIRNSYGLSRPYLIFLVGTPEPRKNLLRTLAAVRKAAPQFSFVLVGPKTPLQEMLHGDVRNITFTDVVPEKHLPALLSGATISLYPSLYEGFGLPVLESMACGVPVITSDRGAIPEIAGDCAVLVDPENIDGIAEAISELLRDETHRDRLRTMGKKRASEFTWQRTAEETLSLYRELI